MALVDNLQNKLTAALDNSKAWWDELRSFANNASDEAERRFPDQD